MSVKPTLSFTLKDSPSSERKKPASEDIPKTPRFFHKPKPYDWSPKKTFYVKVDPNHQATTKWTRFLLGKYSSFWVEYLVFLVTYMTINVYMSTLNVLSCGIQYHYFGKILMKIW